MYHTCALVALCNWPAVHKEFGNDWCVTVGIGAGFMWDNANSCEGSVWFCLCFVDICGHTLRRLRSNKMDYIANNAEQVQLSKWLSHVLREFTLLGFLLLFHSG